jgi:hypothetical protein
MAQQTVQQLILVENITLTWPSGFNGSPVVNDINDIEVLLEDLTITLPDATLVSIGQTLLFNNISDTGYSFTLLLNDGITGLVEIDAGKYFEIYLIDNSTRNGTWRLITPLGGFNGIVGLTAQSTDSSIVITGSPVSPPSGVINFKLPTSLSNLKALNTTDFLVVTQTTPALDFKTVELLGGENITITGGNGLGSDPVIDLNTTLTSLNSITVGDMTLSGGAITNNTDNGNIQISTNGTGSVQINGITINSTGAISGLTNFLGITATFTFTDTLVGMSNQIVIQQQSNISSVTGSNGTYTGTFITPMPNLNYGVTITLGSTGGSLPFISNGYYIVKELTSVTIIVTDASGELVLSAPHGVTVLITSV